MDRESCKEDREEDIEEITGPVKCPLTQQMLLKSSPLQVIVTDNAGDVKSRMDGRRREECIFLFFFCERMWKDMDI